MNVNTITQIYTLLFMSRFYISSESMSLLTMGIAGDKSTYFLMRSKSH